MSHQRWSIWCYDVQVFLKLLKVHNSKCLVYVVYFFLVDWQMKLVLTFSVFELVFTWNCHCEGMGVEETLRYDVNATKNLAAK